jgi:acetolactate synthase-1/2/3 large subunit
VARALREAMLGSAAAVFVSDGGEFGQWAQAVVSASSRVINGPSGAIGGGVPFALGARAARPGSTVFLTIGDGSFGYHAIEIDTAVRCGLPFVAVVGNDAAWNAEYQIQLRKYGEDRLYGCELLPTRYDLLAEALGGHGEHVTNEAQLRPALDRAVASGRPACVNVHIQRAGAPAVSRRSPR